MADLSTPVLTESRKVADTPQVTITPLFALPGNEALKVSTGAVLPGATTGLLLDRLYLADALTAEISPTAKETGKLADALTVSLVSVLPAALAISLAEGLKAGDTPTVFRRPTAEDTLRVSDVLLVRRDIDTLDARVTVAGIDRTSSFIKRLSSMDLLHGRPSTAILVFRGTGWSPHGGDAVSVDVQDVNLFTGQIAKYDRKQPRNTTLYPRFSCSCIDATPMLARRLVTYATFTQVSASTVIQELMTSTGNGFTANHVQPNLPNISLTFQMENLPSCLDKICQAAGLTWRLDSRVWDVHVYLGVDPNRSQPQPLDRYNPHFWNFTYSPDNSQIRTRVISSGGIIQGPGSAPGGGSGSPFAELSTQAGKLIGSYQYAVAFGGTGESTVGSMSNTVECVLASGSIQAIGSITAATDGGHTRIGPHIGVKRYKTAFVSALGSTLPGPAGGTARQALETPQPIKLSDLIPRDPVAHGVTPGGLLPGGHYYYRRSFIGPYGERISDPSDQVTIPALAAVDAPSEASYGGGGDAVGYKWAASLVFADGTETLPGDVFTAGAGQLYPITLSKPGRAYDSAATAWRLYRAPNPAVYSVSTSSFKFVAEIPIATPSYEDSILDAFQGATPPTSSAVGMRLPLTIQAAGTHQGIGDVTGHRLYRTKDGGDPAAGPYYLVAEFSGDTDVAYEDATPDVSLTVPMATDSHLNGESLQVGAAGQSIPVGPSGTLARQVYATKADGAEYFLLTQISNNDADATFLDNVQDDQLTTPAPLTADAGGCAVQLSHIPLGGAGVTQRVLYRTDGIDPTTLHYLTTINDNTTGAFLDTAPDSALGRLPLALSTLTFTGPAAGGLGVTLDNIPAQLALGAVELDPRTGLPTDGIHEFYLAASSFGSADDATAHLQAELNLGALPIESITWSTDDVLTLPGCTPTVTNQAGYTGTPLIQSVHVSWPLPRRTAQFDAVCSGLTRDLIQLLLARSTSMGGGGGAVGATGSTGAAGSVGPQGPAGAVPHNDDLGGTDLVGLVSASWLPVVGARTYIYTAAELTGVTVDAVLFSRTDDAGTSVQLRLRDLTAGTTLVTGSVSTSTASVKEILSSLVLTAGHEYQLEAIGNNTSNAIFSWGYLRFRPV